MPGLLILDHRKTLTSGLTVSKDSFFFRTCQQPEVRHLVNHSPMVGRSQHLDKQTAPASSRQLDTGSQQRVIFYELSYILAERRVAATGAS